MRQQGFSPSLVLMPIRYELREAVGLHAIAIDPALADHPLVPPAQVKEFAGLIEEIPALDAPYVAEDHIWIIDLPGAEKFVEWPSEDSSGISIELKEFPRAAARDFISENENWPADRDPHESIEWLEEHALLAQRLSWTIESLSDAAATALKVPANLTFEG